ncbi:uncharacterized protein LOC108929408 [Scleropages formosus]|uniref:uncharacterized protein LOC108929408 n=1 Tax=Scleropages formosus TaxID=113540 RepID=UPI0010FACA46|nr:uncharacterized protein LOC108929408 [Scleropages formosus]
MKKNNAFAYTVSEGKHTVVHCAVGSNGVMKDTRSAFVNVYWNIGTQQEVKEKTHANLALQEAIIEHFSLKPLSFSNLYGEFQVNQKMSKKDVTVDDTTKKKFINSRWSSITERVPLVNPILDRLLEEKIISVEAYDKIRKEKSEPEKMRAIHRFLHSGGCVAYSKFFQILQECQPQLFDELWGNWTKRKLEDNKENGKKRRRMPGDETDSQTKSMNQEPADGSHPEEDSARFYAIEKMEMYLDNPENRRRIVNELKLELKEGEVKKLEDFLSGMKVKKVFRFSHDAVKKIISCREIKTFLKPGNEKTLSDKVIKHFFEKVRGAPAAAQHQNRADRTGTSVASEISNDNMSDNESSVIDEPLPLHTSSPTFTAKLSVAEENKRGSTSLSMLSLSPSKSCSQTTSPLNGGHCAVTTTNESLPVASSDYPGNHQNVFSDSGFTSLSENQNTKQPSKTYLKLESIPLPLAETPIEDKLFAQDAETPSQNNVKESDVNMDSPDKAVFAETDHIDVNKEKKMKRQRGQVSKKTKEKLQKKTLLVNWARQCIPADKQGTSLEKEELEKIRDGISIVNIREYEQYPCLVCECCMVFTDPHTNKKSIIEVLLKEVNGKSKKLNSQDEFKLQFNMGVLNIDETILLLPDKTVVEAYNDTFDYNVKQFQKIIDKVFIPLLALFKELQRKIQLF